jgi:Holliday junction resolvasome RuvABC endonuclease subunit
MSKKCPKYKTAIYADCLECEDKLCRSNTVKEKIVIGIDQSYKNTGVSIGINNKLIQVTSIYLESLTSNSEKRKYLNNKLTALFNKIKHRQSQNASDVCIIIERIRLQSQGFININYIKAIGALNAVIVDLANEYNFPVYSVDTRAWKSAVVGTSKPLQNKLGINPEKYPTILYVKKLGFESSILVEAGKRKKGVFELNNKKYVYNDDACDSACICLYGFLPKSKQLLKLEY